jgi:enoyl-CoA hydratase/carnithine racemase
MNLVQIEIKDHICTLKMNRADKLNALNWDLIEEFTDSLKNIQKECIQGNIRVLLIGSTNSKAFCAGADLAERIQMTEEKVVETLKKLRILADSINAIPVPTIAVIEGVAFGGGFEIALACDLRICTPQSQMGLTETSLAIIPGAGGTQRLARIVGESRAKELIFLSKRLSAAEATHLGIVNASNESPWVQANLWAKELTTKGPLALRYSKEAISGGIDLPLHEGLDLEHECYLKLLSSHDRKEGLVSFIEKRAPSYKGN